MFSIHFSKYGIKDYSTTLITNNDLLIYPNPAKENITISLVEKSIVNGIIEIYSLQGQLISTINNVNEEHTLNINELVSGTYFVKLISEGNIYTQTFVKN